MILDEFGNRRFFGVYRGVVADVADPLNMGRIKANVPQVMAETVTGWAWPITPTSGQVVTTPSLGEGVFIQFEGGDPSYPLWVGKFKGTSLT